MDIFQPKSEPCQNDHRFFNWYRTAQTSMIPSMKHRKVYKFLTDLGFEPVRQKGSHIFMRNPQTGQSTIFVEGKGEYNPMTLRNTLRQIGIGVPDFRRYWDTGQMPTRA